MQTDEVMINGHTQAQTAATASVAGLTGQAKIPSPAEGDLTDERISSIAAGPWWSDDGVDPIPFARAVIAADRAQRHPSTSQEV